MKETIECNICGGIFGQCNCYFTEDPYTEHY